MKGCCALDSTRILLNACRWSRYLSVKTKEYHHRFGIITNCCWFQHLCVKTSSQILKLDFCSKAVGVIAAANSGSFNNHGWKNLTLSCKLLHAFDVVERSFAMKEEEIEDFFFDGRLRMNKQRVGKRFAKVQARDVVDLIKSVSEEEVAMKRVEVLAIRRREGRWEVEVRRKKHLVLKRIRDCEIT